MNILYIEHYAGSPEMGMEFRPYYLASEWVKMGHHVWIIAADYSHLRRENPVVEEDFKEQELDGITYVWIKTGTYEGNGLARALTMFRFVHKLRKNARWIAIKYKPDVIITSSTYPLDTYAGQKIKKWTKKVDDRKANGAILIHEVHDMWPVTLIEIGGMKRSNPFVILMQMGENSFCKNSDYIVSLLCAAKDYFIHHGMAESKFKVVLNGIVTEEWDNPDDLPEEHRILLDSLQDEGKFIICFFGSITKSYALDYLISAQKKMKSNKTAVVVVGEGNQLEELKKVNVSGVFFLPKIAKRAVPSLMKYIDCCYIGALRNKMFRFGICMNKLFDSMMSGKPILYAVDAPNNYINEYSCGITVEAENTDALIEGIKKMLDFSEEERRRMGENGRQAVMDHFTYDRLAVQFADLFQEDTK